jgi:hypothetical protein
MVRKVALIRAVIASYDIHLELPMWMVIGADHY